MEHMMLQLKRSTQQERELEKLIEELHDSSSPIFHHWLTAKEFGERFGLAQQDLETITRWLESHGFKVNVVYENGLLIDFSGTAGQIRSAFHTEIHQLNVMGQKHVANIRDPQIPSALVSAVTGVVSMHDFRPKAMYKAKADYTFSTGGYEYEAVVPADLATIYNLNPLFNAKPTGISGQGQTIVLIEDTDLYSTSDWDTFRTTFGLSQYAGGSLTQIHPHPPSGPNNCIDPHTNQDDVEAAIDVEYASAAAPSAAIELASCLDTSTFGGLFAIQNLLNASSAPPTIISMSYGECEAYNGAAGNAAYNAAYQQAVTEGVSMYVSAGDDGASSCSGNYYWATTGIGVSGFASTPYNVAVGGTDFGDTYAGTNSAYWSSTNTSTYGSALSYVPEIPWNDTCASHLIAESYQYSVSYGDDGFCYSATGEEYWFGGGGTVAGSGGPSGCATGESAQSGIVGGTCAGYAKPSWQSLVGVPNDGVRDIPDISLFAANGVWGHFYPVCISDPSYGFNCAGAPDTWDGGGGTSFASPIMAGIQALINQKTGERQGNPNPTYYKLAAAEYGASGDSSCNSTLGNTASSSCIFHDVTLGDNDIACQTYDCYWPNANESSPSDPTVGVLSTSTSSCEPTAADGSCGTYFATVGWDFPTGIGSVNAANLVNNWPEPSSGFTLAATPTALTIIHGNSATSAIAIIPQGGFSGNVSLKVSGLPSGVTAVFSSNPATTSSTLTLTVSATAAPAAATLTITGTSGKLTNSTTLSLTVTVGNPAFTLSAAPTAVTIMQGVGSGTSTVSVAPENGFSGEVSFAVSGLPKGVTASFSTNPTTSATMVTFTASLTAKKGTATVTITGTSIGLAASTTVSLTVTPLGNFTLKAAPKTLTIERGNSASATITVVPSEGFDQNVALSTNGLPKGVTASFSQNPAASTSTVTFNTSLSALVGEATVTINGIYGDLGHQAFVTLTITK
ncbi:MAG: protease pro-enzyme activation domain-containing protein [Terriglobales bacterium]|jgi:subtilase family serine protease